MELLESNVYGPRISSTQGDILNQSFSMEEIELEVKQLPKLKAPEPDGMHGIFLKRFWHIMKFDIKDFLDGFLVGIGNCRILIILLWS